MGDSVALKARLRSFWNSYDPYWESIETGSCTHSANRQRVFEFIPHDPSAKVLDLGCGNGANGKWLKDKCQYVGLDVSSRALERALCRPASLVCGDTDALPFKNEAFDAVVATFVTEHLVNPQRALQEVFRVARKGGRIILLGPTWDFPFWYPNSLKTRGCKKWWRLLYTLQRFGGQLRGWLFKRFPFYIVSNPDVFRAGYTYDEDAVYVAWSYEIVEYLRRLGSALYHWEVDDRLLGNHPVARFLKSTMLGLPPFRHAGCTSLFVFEKQ